MNTLFFRNRRVVALAIFMILAVGLSALTSMGRQEDPTITNLYATVITPYPGADPARVESLVTEKIEDELKQIPEIKEVRSTSRTGISIIRVELGWDLADAEIEQIWSQVRDALSDAARNFPQGVPEPEFDDDRTGAFSVISAITAKPGRQISPAVTRRYGELLQDRLRDISGTKQVEIYGEREEEILVTIDPRKLASLGLSAAQVSAAIAQADAKIRAGQVRGQTSDLLIEVTGEIRSLDRIRNVPLLEAADGRIARVADIAEISRAVREPASSMAYADGSPAILVAAKMEDNLQVDEWIGRVRQALTVFETEMPAGLEHRLLFDQSGYTADRFVDVMTNLAIGTALVVAVLLITLGWRSALIVAVILPLASLISLAGLQVLAIPIHQMSITGLIVALGLLVDAGIVMTDEVRKTLDAGASRLDAVGKAVDRLKVPLLASTVTTALAFMPMAILPGPAGDFVGAIAMAVIIMLAASLALALTITPALAGWFLVDSSAQKTAGILTSGIQLPRIGALFGRFLDLALSYPKLAILGALILPLIGFGAMPTLKAQFFPGVDRDQFYVQLKLPDSGAIVDADRAAREADSIIRNRPGVTEVHWVVGESAPAFYYNMIRDQDGVSSFAEALVTTQSPDATEEIIPDLQRSLDVALPEARVIVRGLVQGPPVEAPVEIRVVGPDLQVLRRIGDEVRAIMVDSSDVLQVRTQLTAGAPKVVVDIDENKARLAGLELSSVADQLETTLEGITGGSLIEASEELPVRVRVGAADRGSIDAVRALDLLAPGAIAKAASGAYPGVPLTAIGTVGIEPSETSIFRRNGERMNTIQGFVHRDVLPEEALKKIQRQIADRGVALPPGYRFEVGGDADARQEVMTNLVAAMGIVVTLTIITIVLTFNSFRLSLITGIVAVLSMGLSLLALAVFAYPFGIMAVIGVIGSIGVSINAAIIVLTALQKNADAMAGNRAAIRDTVLAQSRHIVSTTITTFGGFLPLILAGGGFWPPFAMAIAGGVILSSVVSFFFVPPAFALVVRRSTSASEDRRSGPAIEPLSRSALDEPVAKLVA